MIQPLHKIASGIAIAANAAGTFVVILLIAVVFTAFAALVFSVLTLLLGMVWDDFEVSGPDGWTLEVFGEFYLRYLIIAAVFTFVSLPLGNGLSCR